MSNRSVLSESVPIMTLCLALVLTGLAAFSVINRDIPSFAALGANANEIKDALNRLDATKRASLVAREKRRLAAEPLEYQRLNELSALMITSGEHDAGEALLKESATRTKRDWPSQVTSAGFHLKKGEIKEAVGNIDAALRSNSKSGDELYPSLLSLLSQGEYSEKLVPELITVLNGSPPWRSDFMTWLTEHDQAGRVTAQLMSAGRRAGAVGSVAELRQFLTTQIAKKNYERAYFVWLDSLNETELRKVGLVYDGKFDLQSNDLFFDWTYTPYTNGEMSITQKSDDASDRALRLDFSDSRSGFQHFQQFVRLSPGQYEFSGKEAADNFSGQGGLSWQVYCIENDALLGHSEAFKSSSPWTDFKFEFSVPDSGCQTQRLRIQSASAAALDAGLNGTIYFDDIDIKAME